MVDDTPVSSTVSTGTVRAGAVSAAQSDGERGEAEPVPNTPTPAPTTPLSGAPLPGPSGVAPARTSSTSSALFESASEEEEFAVDSGWGSVAEASPSLPAVSRSLPRLELAPPEPPRLLYEKAQDPSDESPILYCERVYVVDSLQSDDELAEHLLDELSRIQSGWSERDSSQFVQLAAFDHAFESEPQYPPLATLSWKDWHGRTELWVRGVRRSGAPPALDERDAEPAAAEPDADNRAVPDAETTDDATPLAGGVIERSPPRSGDSGTSWQSPARSGEYPIPTAEEPSPEPPSSQRVLVGEELIGALFERMNELSYLPDLAAGASYVLETLEEFIPCSGISIHVLDPHRREFVLVRALGPRAQAQQGSRQAAPTSPLLGAVQHGRALRQPGTHTPLWSELGLEIEQALCAPVQQRDRIFGAIELGRSAAQGEFNDGQLEALDFICEQFAEFLAERPFSTS